MPAITATKLSLKYLPAELKAWWKTHTSKRNFSLVVVNDDDYRVLAYDTIWSGGTRNMYYTFWLSDMAPRPAARSENERFAVQSGGGVIAQSVFCGVETNPTVYVRNLDLPAFFGILMPYEYREMPAELAADWMDETAANLPPRKAKIFRAVAALIRKVTGLATAA